jgi:sugar phosphate isomerase/epimerase
MAQDEGAASPAGAGDTAVPPGIPWEPGDEDYPFASVAGETALDFFARWLDEAGYARIDQAGTRYIHETDVANVLNHVTADVGLLRARLGTFGDRVVTAEAYDATVDRIERAAAELGQALDVLRQSRD